MAATIGASTVDGTWSWWYVLPISIVAVFGVLFHLCAVAAVNLDDTDQPITGRDAVSSADGNWTGMVTDNNPAERGRHGHQHLTTSTSPSG